MPHVLCILHREGGRRGIARIVDGPVWRRPRGAYYSVVYQIESVQQRRGHLVVLRHFSVDLSTEILVDHADHTAGVDHQGGGHVCKHDGPVASSVGSTAVRTVDGERDWDARAIGIQTGDHAIAHLALVVVLEAHAQGKGPELPGSGAVQAADE